MSRKKVQRHKKVHALEVKYHNVLLSKFIRMLMWDGKLSVAERLAYDALQIVEDKFKQSGVDAFIKALENVRPMVKVKARRVGGSTYQVPIEVPEDLGYTLAMRWIISAARKQKGAAMAHKLSQELIAAFEQRGTAYKMREDVHRMAEANKAFAHYRV